MQHQLILEAINKKMTLEDQQPKSQASGNRLHTCTALDLVCTAVMNRVAEYHMIIYNRIFIPAVYIGMRERGKLHNT